jgi:hypothetical protein
MADEFPRQLINAGPLELIEFVPLEVINRRSTSDCDVEAFAVEYISIHDGSPPSDTAIRC